MRDFEIDFPIGGGFGFSGRAGEEVAERARSRGTHAGSDSSLVGRPRLLLLVWAFLVQLLLVRAFAWGVLPAMATVSVAPLQINVNRAGFSVLQALPGVGPGLAGALILDRIRHGPFARMSDLDRVHGFGPRLLASLDGLIQF